MAPAGRFLSLPGDTGDADRFRYPQDAKSHVVPKVPVASRSTHTKYVYDEWKSCGPYRLPKSRRQSPRRSKTGKPLCFESCGGPYRPSERWTERIMIVL